MSSILKALKKIEAEKSPREETVPKIDLTGYASAPPAEKRIPVLWLWGVAVVAATIIILLSVALLKKSSSPVQAVATTAPQSVPQPPAVTELVPAVQIREPQVAPAPAPLQADKSSGTHQPAPIRQQEPVKQLQRQREPELPGETVPAAPESKSSEPAVRHKSEDTGFTLNGIGWNKESSERIAVINGQYARTGGKVAGLIIEEILQDRVKIIKDGKRAELFIGKAATGL